MTFPVPQKVILPFQLGDFQLVETVRGGLWQLASEMYCLCLLYLGRERRGSRMGVWERSFNGSVIFLSVGRRVHNISSSLRCDLYLVLGGSQVQVRVRKSITLTEMVRALLQFFCNQMLQ